MRIRSSAIPVVGLLFLTSILGACSSGGSDGKSTPSTVDPALQNLINGTAAPTTAPSGSDDTVVAGDGTTINVTCLSTELNKRLEAGEFQVVDLQTWISGTVTDGPVQAAATEIANSGVCSQ